MCPSPPLQSQGRAQDVSTRHYSMNHAPTGRQREHPPMQVVQQLLEEQCAVAQLERRLGEAEAALSAAAEELVTLRSLNFGSGRDRDEGVQAMMTQLHDRVRLACLKSCALHEIGTNSWCMTFIAPFNVCCHFCEVVICKAQLSWLSTMLLHEPPRMPNSVMLQPRWCCICRSRLETVSTTHIPPPRAVIAPLGIMPSRTAS